MAATLITQNPVYYGTMAEILVLTGVQPGSLGFATDQGCMVTTQDGSTWVAYRRLIMRGTA